MNLLKIIVCYSSFERIFFDSLVSEGTTIRNSNVKDVTERILSITTGSLNGAHRPLVIS